MSENSRFRRIWKDFTELYSTIGAIYILSIIVAYLVISLVEREIFLLLPLLECLMVAPYALLLTPLVFVFGSLVDRYLVVASILMTFAAAIFWLGLEYSYVTDNMRKPGAFHWSDTLSSDLLAHYLGAIVVGVLFYRERRYGDVFQPTNSQGSFL